MSSGTILISDATYKQSIALARYLKEANPCCHIVGCTKYLSKFQGLYQHFYHQFYDDFVVGPFAEKIQEISHVLAIPVGVFSTKILLSINHPQAVLPPALSFETAMSREDTFILGRKLKIKVPKTYYPVSFDGLLTIPIPFPWIMKGVLDSDKNIIHVVKNIHQARKRFYAIQHYFSQKDKPPIVQEYAPGHTIVFNAFYQNGVLKRFFIYRPIRQLPITGGICTAAETLDHPLALECGKKVLDALNWNGSASVEFKENQETGELTLLKIDPKLSSSLEIGLAAGVNFGDLLLRSIKGEDIPFSREYAKIKFYWPFQGDLVSIFNSRKWGQYREYFQDDYMTNVRTDGVILNAVNLFKAPFLPYN